MLNLNILGVNNKGFQREWRGSTKWKRMNSETDDFVHH